jgi:DNA replication protein DnaC
LKEAMHRAVSFYKLLIIDRIGYLPLAREIGQPVLPARRQALREGTMILISNLTFGSWDQAFAGP